MSKRPSLSWASDRTRAAVQSNEPTTSRYRNNMYSEAPVASTSKAQLGDDVSAMSKLDEDGDDDADVPNGTSYRSLPNPLKRSLSVSSDQEVKPVIDGLNQRQASDPPDNARPSFRSRPDQRRIPTTTPTPQMGLPQDFTFNSMPSGSPSPEQTIQMLRDVITARNQEIADLTQRVQLQPPSLLGADAIERIHQLEKEVTERDAMIARVQEQKDFLDRAGQKLVQANDDLRNELFDLRGKESQRSGHQWMEERTKFLEEIDALKAKLRTAEDERTRQEGKAKSLAGSLTQASIALSHERSERKRLIDRAEALAKDAYSLHQALLAP